LQGIKIGIAREYFGAGVEAGVGAAVEAALRQYEKLGATLVEISLPNSLLAIPAYYVIAPAEASSNLARYDGVRYGRACAEPKSLEDLYTRSRSEGFGAEVQRRILVGTYALSAGYYDAYYLRAQRVRRLIANDFAEAFKSVDLIAGPTTPTVAFKLGEKTSDPLAMYAADVNTVAVNLAGLPAISVPAGLSENLPVGLQLIAPAFAEGALLSAAHQFQMATDWHAREPRA
jgi:aspartyl-tRNA(Asn)/glutamyl-tRNA(Gln) amidotransferase subunit A